MSETSFRPPLHPLPSLSPSVATDHPGVVGIQLATALAGGPPAGAPLGHARGALVGAEAPAHLLVSSFIGKSVLINSNLNVFTGFGGTSRR